MDLDSLRQSIIDHPDNLWAKKLGYAPVYTASPEARIMIVGQAPGRKAQDSQKPWNDVSGDTLRQWLGIDKYIFYGPKISLLPMDFYYPGKGVHGDLPPRPGFAKLWHPQFLEQMKDIKLILLVGHYSQKYYLAENAKQTLTENVRSYKEYLPAYFPLVHPSPLNYRWRSKNKWFEDEVLPVLKDRFWRALD